MNPNENTEFCSTSTSTSSSSLNDEPNKPNWELLKETLGDGALSALKEHLEGIEQELLSNKTIDDRNESSNIRLDPDGDGDGDGDGGTHSKSNYLPKQNTTYAKQEYWEERFASEDDFEWLVSYDDVKSQIKGYLTPKSRILIVGCGNSNFSSDLYDDGYTNIVNIDYSQNVIEKMKLKNSHRNKMTWVVMDMTNMNPFSNESFDVVIDKAAMDAIMTEENDVWNPDENVIHMARLMCQHISRILVPNGYHLHISFAQPHFRKKYLLGLHNQNQIESHHDDNYSKEFQWDFKVETIGNSDSGCFHHFLYIMQKLKS